MLKYTNTQITFREVPNLVTRCFSISNCGGHCTNCHSPELQGDNGEELTKEVLINYFEKDKDTADCYVFLGDGNDPKSMVELLKTCKEHKMKTCLYLGHWYISYPNYLDYLDYLKLGNYDNNLGNLECNTTNQRMYTIKNITSTFWNK